MRAKLLALVAGSAIALTVTAPAQASTWSGNNFQFGLGSSWDFSNWGIGDVDLGDASVAFDATSDESGLYTDLWDGSLNIYVTSPTAGVDYAGYECASDADIEITAGDDVDIQCTTDWADVTNDDVSVRGNIHIYGPDGDLIRYALAITNNSGEDITDFVVNTDTDFGSDGDIWGYQNFDAAILDTPADDSNDNADAIEETGSDWISTISNDEDAPGSLAWGNSGGSVNVSLTETSGDVFYTQSDEFTVAAGETVYLVYFLGWDPANLVELGYGDNDFADNADIELAADAVLDAASEFDAFSGRLTSGLDDANVINWGPAPEANLAETGVDASGIALGGALVLAAGAAVVIRRRARA